MKKTKTFLLLASIIFSTTCFAIEDTPENRKEQVERYLKATPPQELFEDIANSLSMNYPPEDRPALRKILLEYIDLTVLTDAMVASMTKHFTADELKALADFYESPVGKSAMSKMGVYMAEVMPVVQAEVMRAIGEFQRQEAEANRQLSDSE